MRANREVSRPVPNELYEAVEGLSDKLTWEQRIEKHRSATGRVSQNHRLSGATPRQDSAARDPYNSV